MISFTDEDWQANKIKAGLGYIVFFLPLILCRDSKLGRHCANQGLILFIVSLLAGMVLGIFAGVLACCGTIWLMSRLFGLSRGVYATLLPKSITTAIGMDLSDQLGGSANVTVACIIFTGLFGNLVASSFLKLCRITDPIAVGLAIGTSSHALGTSRAHELGRTQEAMSSLSIAVAGLMTVAAASVFANLY